RRDPLLFLTGVVAHGDPLHQIDRDPLHPVHPPGQADPKARPGLLLQNPAEAVDYRPLPGADLGDPGEQRKQEGHGRGVEEEALHHLPPFLAVLPLAGASALAGDVLPLGFSSTSNSSRWVDRYSTVLPSPRIRP